LKNLIVNADDLGWTEGINRGIADAHRRGLVTSTSLLANGRAFESGLAVSRKHNWPRYESLQPLYNLYERAVYETELEPLALQEKLGVIPYYSLASGFLTGKYRSQDDLK